MKKIVLYFTAGLLFAVPTAYSQVQSEPTELATFLEKKGYVAIPIQKLSTGHLLLMAEVNGIIVRLILDTGAGVTVFDKSNEKRLRLQSLASDTQASGAGGRNLTMKTANVQNFKIGDYLLADFEIYLMSLEHVNGAFEQMGLERIDGVIGADILTAGKAIIDYANLTLFLKNNITDSNQ